MTQTPSMLAERKQSSQPPYSGSDQPYATAANQAEMPEPEAHEARPVLHLPVRMRGVYRHAPSLKGA